MAKGKILFEKIKDRRIEIDFTQQMVADLTGLGVSQIKAIETGRSETSFENVKKLADVLGIDVSDIYIKDFRNTKVLTVCNNKGGCGKTSVVSGLAYALSELDDDNKILLIDGDMQMNLTRSYGLERDTEYNLNVALLDELSLEGFIKKTDYPSIDLIIADLGLSTIETVLYTKRYRETLFKRILDPVVNKGIYDYIIIDTNPTLGMLNFNILNASDYVIIPVELSAFGIDGLEILTEYINEVKKVNPNFDIAGVLQTKVDKRESITKKAEETLKTAFGDIIFESYIPIDTSIKKAQWNYVPVNVLDKNSRASKQYKNLAKEVAKVVK